jgi:hypothetical protein
MTHKHNPKQTSKTITRKTRTAVVRQLAELLWDQSKPDGEEAVPEDQWEEILTGPCNGDKQLIAEVCESERSLRKAMESDPEPITVSVPKSLYLFFVFEQFQVETYPIFLLWKMDTSEWHPEDKWDGLLEQWKEGSPASKESMKDHARKLKEVLETGKYTYFS